MRKRVLTALLVGSLWGCSSSNSGTPSGVDSGGNPTSGNDAQAPAVNQTVGTSGGTLETTGVVLTIPAGALASDVDISIVPDAAPLPNGYVGLSPLFRFEPTGTTFAVPVNVTLTLTSSGSDATIYLSNSGGGFDALATTTSAMTATAAITRLGDCFVAVGGHGTDGGTGSTSDAAAADAAAGEDAAVTAGFDATVADAQSSADAGTGSDSGSPAADSGEDDATSTVDNEAGTTGGEAGSVLDSGTGPSDAGASVTDAGGAVFTVSVDGTPTSFANSAQLSVTAADTSTPSWVLQGNDNSSATHWQLQMTFTASASQTCEPFMQPNFPQIIYTHFSAGIQDANYSTHAQNVSGSTCSLALTGSAPTASGEAAVGTFSGTLYETADAGTADGGASHSFAAGSFDEVLP